VPRKYRVTQYYASDNTLMDAILETAPAWERAPMILHWRGLKIEISNERKSCTKCRRPLWNEQTNTPTCTNCRRTT
jgi:hypothetical protein